MKRNFADTTERLAPGSYNVGSSNFTIKKITYDAKTSLSSTNLPGSLTVPTAATATNRAFDHVFDILHGEEKKSFIIINNFGDKHLLDSLKIKFKIHSLSLEDIVNTHQRNKYEKYHKDENLEYEICILREPHDDRQISLIVTKTAVLLFQEDKDEACTYFITSRIERAEGKIRERDTGYLTFALIDSVIDDYFIKVEKMEEEEEELERKIESGKNVDFSEISNLKKKIVEFRKNAVSLREMTIRMCSSEDSLLNIDPRNVPYFRDLSDHATRVVEHAEKLRDISMGLVDLLDAVTSAKTNTTVKILTVMSVIFMPITFISQVYGMNFEGIVEIHWKHGYMIFWITVIAIAASIMWLFKKKKWL